eukprot:scaffold307647_cov45-Prasinocladus_malaysianus.AAC.1
MHQRLEPGQAWPLYTAGPWPCSVSSPAAQRHHCKSSSPVAGRRHSHPTSCKCNPTVSQH